MKSVKLNLYNILLVLYILFTVINSINCFMKNVNIKAPKKLSNCKAQLDDGRIIDLSSLDNSQQPK